MAEEEKEGEPGTVGTFEVENIVRHKKARQTGEYIYIWSPGKVVRVADGLTDKTTKMGKKLLPAGAVLWAWEADAEFDEEPGEEWLTLRKDKFNEQVWYGWRLDPRELVARQPGAARTPEAQRGARRGGCEAP